MGSEILFKDNFVVFLCEGQGKEYKVNIFKVFLNVILFAVFLQQFAVLHNSYK